MIGGCAQGHLGTLALRGVDQGPAAEATLQHLSESIIQGTNHSHSYAVSLVLLMFQFTDGHIYHLTGPHLLGGDLCRAHQWPADQGAPALPLVGLPAGRGLVLLASEI